MSPAFTGPPPRATNRMLSGRIETETGAETSIVPGTRHLIRRPPWISTSPRPLEAASRFPVEQIGRADKAGDEGVGRAEVDILRGADLADAALVDDSDGIGQRQRLRLIVRDIDRRNADLALQALELAAHFVAQLRIEVGQRLVEQEEPRLVHDGARQRHALLLAAGEPRRRPLLKAGEIDDRESALATASAISAFE